MHRGVVVLMLLALVGGITFLGLAATITVPDDYPTIQAAIDAAQAGDTIEVKAGSYEENITVNKSLSLEGAGDWKSIISGEQEVTPLIVINGSDIEVNLKNLTIARTKIGTQETYNEEGVDIQGNPKVHIIGCTIFGNWGDGIFALDAARVEVRNCKIEDNDTAVGIGGHAQATIVGNHVANNARGGIAAFAFGHATIINNQILENEESGITVKDCGTVFIENNIISGNGGGVGIYQLAQAIIKGNRIIDNKGGGIGISDRIQALQLATCETPLQVTISQNEITGNGDTAITMIGHVRQVSAIVDTNTISRNAKDALSIAGLARAKVINNIIKGNGGAGMFAGPQAVITGENNKMLSNGVDLEGNVPSTVRVPLAAETSASEIVFPGDYATLQEAIDAAPPNGAIIISSGDYAAGLTIWKPVSLIGAGEEQTVLHGASDHPVISIIQGISNVTIANMSIIQGRQGILSYGTAAIRRCKIANNALNGVTLASSASVTIQNCEILDNNFSGITVSGASKGIISGSEVNGNREQGVFITGPAHYVIQDSSIDNNGYGIILREESNVEISNSQIMGNIANGIQISEAHATIEGDGILNNGSDGIAIHGSSNVIITNNTIQGNKGRGIFADLGTTVSGTNNSITNNGIDLEGNAPATLRKLSDATTTVRTARVPTDFQTIQDAITAVRPGGTVFIESGEYKVSELVIEKPISLIAIGNEVVLHGRSDTSTIIVNSVKNVVLCGLTIEGGKTGVKIYGSTTIRDCQFTKNGTGISVGGSVIISDTMITASTSTGISLWGHSQTDVTESEISGNEGCGVFAYKNAAVKIERSDISDNGGDGLIVSGEANATITKSTISRNAKNGVDIEAGDAVIDGNKISKNVEAGINISGFVISPSVTITRNEISGSKVGINIFWGHSTIDTNRISNNFTGIRIGNLTRTEILDNVICGSNGYGVLIDGSDCLHAGKKTDFKGEIKGSGNRISKNGAGAVCPADLSFLISPQGGSYTHLHN